jgi:D-glycero-D-manno-heptose 1,7-bisphosphate phosphatase
LHTVPCSREPIVDFKHLDAVFYRPHASRSCGCRKPEPGMLQRAARQHQITLNSTVMIGDSETDVATGRAASTATILLHSGPQISSRNIDFIVADLAEAVRLIFSDKERSLSL